MQRQVVAGNLPGHEIEHPMAVVIMGGLISSTLLTLLALPAMYLRFGRCSTVLPPSTSIYRIIEHQVHLAIPFFCLVSDVSTSENYVGSE